LNKHKYAEALDLFTKGLQNPGAEKKELLFDIARTQQRLGNATASMAAYQQVTQEITQELGKTDREHVYGLGALHSFLGMVYASSGDAASAVSEGRKGMAMDPTSEDPFEGPQREETMALVYALLGDADNAIPILKRWINVPSSTGIAPTLLRVNEFWDPIRNDRRFQELVAEKEP